MRKLALLLFLMVMTCIPLTPTLAAQPRYLSPYGYVHDIRNFAMNLVPGGVVEVGMWLEMLAYEPETTIRYVGEFGSIVVDISHTDSGRSFNVVSETISADALMEQCNRGVIQVNEKIEQMDINGNYSILLSKRTNLAPCSWADSPVPAGPAIAPTIVVVCGPNNDRITLAAQPAHVVLLSDSGWVSGERVLRYGVDSGYTLTGSGDFRLYDNPNLLCPSPIKTPPVVINTPTPRPTSISILPTPRGFPIPIITIVPRTPYPPDYTPPAVPPTPTPNFLFPYPVRPTPWGFPLPLPTFATLNLPPQEVRVDTSELASDGPRVREVAVLSLAPVAVIFAMIGGIRRRDE